MERINDSLLFDFPNRANSRYMLNLEPLRVVLMKHGHLPQDGEKYKNDDPLFYVTGFNNYENTVEYSDELTPYAERCADCDEAFHHLDLFEDPNDQGCKVCEFCLTISAFHLLERWEQNDNVQDLAPEALRIVATLRDVYMTSDACHAASIVQEPAQKVIR